VSALEHMGNRMRHRVTLHKTHGTRVFLTRCDVRHNLRPCASVHFALRARDLSLDGFLVLPLVLARKLDRRMRFRTSGAQVHRRGCKLKSRPLLVLLSVTLGEVGCRVRSVATCKRALEEFCYCKPSFF
jgi:hypothetical protein